MVTASSAKKTQQQIRAQADKLISDHKAGVQGWLSAHSPNMIPRTTHGFDPRDEAPEPHVNQFEQAQSIKV
jgi:hypothetical protein